MKDAAVEKWEHPDGYWTPEMSAAVDECRAGTRSTIPCPVCGVMTKAVTVDEIFPEIHYPDRPPFRVATVGRLMTLEPCGHALKRTH